MLESAASHYASVGNLKKQQVVYKVVGIIQNCSPEEAYQRWENIQKRVTDHHNESVRKR